MPDQAPLGLVSDEGHGPPLVAVHGTLLGGRFAFGGVAPRWAAQHRVLVVDRPGFEATGGDGEVTFDEQADRLLATLAAHAPDQPAHAVGVDVGGLVVLAALQRRPAAFASVVLVEVPAEDLCPPDMVEVVRFGRLVREVHEAVPDDPDAVGRLLAAVDPALWRALAPALRRGDPGLAAPRSDLAIWTARLDRHRLAAVVSGDRAVPVLVLSGTTGDPAFRTFGACTAAALLGQHVAVQGAGHAAHLHPRGTDLLLAHTAPDPAPPHPAPTAEAGA